MLFKVRRSLLQSNNSGGLEKTVRNGRQREKALQIHGYSTQLSPVPWLVWSTALQKALCRTTNNLPYKHNLNNSRTVPARSTGDAFKSTAAFALVWISPHRITAGRKTSLTTLLLSLFSTRCSKIQKNKSYQLPTYPKWFICYALYLNNFWSVSLR